MSKDNIVYTVIIGLLIICMAGIYDSKPISFAGLIHNVQESFDEGIAVDGTEIIDGDGNYVGAITGTTGTLSSTLVVTGNTAITGTLTVTGETNVANFVQGGSSYTADAATHVALTAAQMCNNSYIKITPTVGHVNVTTAATTTLIADCIPAIGDRVSFYYENGASAATTTTIVAGAGVDLIEPSGGDVVISQNEDAFIEFLNVDGSIVKVFVTSMQAAD